MSATCGTCGGRIIYFDGAWFHTAEMVDPRSRSEAPLSADLDEDHDPTPESDG